MNKQGKDGIAWCDMTWNPVSGCLHNCPYCYAAKVARRFGTCENNAYDVPDSIKEILTKKHGVIVELNERLEGEPYPYNFVPTFHKYRLDEPAKIKKPSKIFVVSMGDLFGEWIPDSWIQEVFKTCQEVPQHKYLFLTKNPKRYAQKDLIREYLIKSNYYSHSYFGVSVTNQQMMDEAINQFSKINIACPKFISIEPLFEAIQITDIQVLSWVILGQQTGPGAKPPKPEWVQPIIGQCRAAGVPVFIKSPLYQDFKIQEWPEGSEEIQKELRK